MPRGFKGVQSRTLCWACKRELYDIKGKRVHDSVVRQPRLGILFCSDECMEVHTAFGRAREEMADQPEPEPLVPGIEWDDPDEPSGLIDTRESPSKAIIEHNAKVIGAGRLPPEIRNIGREMPDAGDTAPVQKPARRWLRRS